MTIAKKLANALFTTRADRQGDKVVLTVSGVVDERSDFSNCLAELTQAKTDGASTLVIDMEGVRQLNSVGVKRWITFLATCEKYFKLRFRSISEAVVAQSNVISAVLGMPGTPVDRFGVPYICPHCKTAMVHSMGVGDLVQEPSGKFKAPQKDCPNCSKPMSFDEYEEEYFFFLKHMGAAKG